MTISTIDPATPLDSDVAGQGDDQLRAFKAAIVNQFAGEAGDLYDIPVTVGPRSLNLVNDKANQSDLDTTDANVATNTTDIGTLQTESLDYESRISAIEADYTTLSQAAGAAWPVGSLFISADGGTPTAKGLPGTWAVVGDGRVLLGDPTTGTLGGSNTVTLAEDEIPPHKHQHSTYREDSGVQGVIPAEFRTSPTTTFASHLSGRSNSSGEFAIFNTDEGINTVGNPVTLPEPLHLTVRFYERTA